MTTQNLVFYILIILSIVIITYDTYKLWKETI